MPESMVWSGRLRPCWAGTPGPPGSITTLQHRPTGGPLPGCQPRVVTGTFPPVGRESHTAKRGPSPASAVGLLLPRAPARQPGPGASRPALAQVCTVPQSEGSYPPSLGQGWHLPQRRESWRSRSRPLSEKEQSLSCFLHRVARPPLVPRISMPCRPPWRANTAVPQPPAPPPRRPRLPHMSPRCP